jgi:hypothetical protein
LLDDHDDICPLIWLSFIVIIIITTIIIIIIIINQCRFCIEGWLTLLHLESISVILLLWYTSLSSKPFHFFSGA